MANPIHTPEVLIVDDDVQLRSALFHLFMAEGYDVGIATNGVEAIDWLENHSPCAVVLDLLMPGIVGQEVIEQIQEDAVLPATRIAIISGSPDLAPQGYKVFPKPLDEAELVGFVRDCCSHRDAS